MSEQTEGPYHPAMNRLSVKFGPDEFQVKFSRPETVGTECILMNMGFAQGQASSAKEVEVYRKALERISKPCIGQHIYRHDCDGCHRREIANAAISHAPAPESERRTR